MAIDRRTCPSAGVRLGIDIGGTFTDIVLYDIEGRLWEHKVSTSTSDEARAVVSGTLELLERSRVLPRQVTEVVHASTIATNAILERSGPQVALVTTFGFRDVLEIARIRTPKLYDLGWRKPPALVARRHRYEVNERIGADGQIVTPLDEESVLDVIAQLRSAAILDVAVSLLNSPVNSEHERRIGQLFAEHYPGSSVSLSSLVLPELKEYERTSTTVVNAYLQPVMRRYLTELKGQLLRHGIDAPLNVMRSDGGMMSDAATCARPVAAVISGPAAGVTAAHIIAKRSGRSDVLAFDMGGTTAKATLIEGGRVPRVNEYEVRDGISTPSRFIKAGGYLLMVPAIDLAEVGNGAGSIARVDAGGALVVGPDSAGAEPGPACYGRGGARPTITDANVVLGYLNPRQLIGGALDIRPELAERAVENVIGRPLGLDTVRAAWGIHSLANSNMIRAIRSVTIERGRDPRAFSLVAFGGSGPVHAAGIASEMGMPAVIVPRFAGLLSAVGLLASRVEHQFSRVWARPLASTNRSELQKELQPLVEQACAALEAERHEAEEVETLIDLHFAGQSSVLSTTFYGSEADAVSMLVKDFTDEYRRTYGHLLQDEPIEVMTLRAIARAPAPTRDIYGVASPLANARAAGSRQAYFGPHAGYLEAQVLSRADLTDRSVKGPILIDEYDTTIVVPPGWSAVLIEDLSVLMEKS